MSSKMRQTLALVVLWGREAGDAGLLTLKAAAANSLAYKRQAGLGSVWRKCCWPWPKCHSMSSSIEGSSSLPPMVALGQKVH